jgi:solute carrier family 12 sodium/potassium/chloride transporter 2
MSSQKKFGAFAGVFTPSLLTILGVIMYMRLGWVVGNSGLVGAILIIVVAHVISITTGLSISSIATDKKVGAGGVYYVLSRSLGLPIGGAIGVTLFAGTALSIALYLIGFAESFNAYLGLQTDINGLRIGGSLALLALTILAFISTSLALKAQFFILAAIVISLISIFFGVSPEAPKSLAFFSTEGSASMEAVFAVFFPAVTGFTAGIAMSGDLQNPKKAIPVGTLWSIAVGFVVYIGLACFIFFSVDPELLKTDNNVLMKLALFAPAVVAGIWGATLSSALGGILGGPRILQAMSVDKITPRVFGRGIGKANEPRNALILTVIIAQSGILIGELDTIARVCSMFYLTAYGFINLSFFLESWASTDFNPTFKVKRWVGLVGFIATFVVMFRLDMVAMLVAFLVIGGIYFWLAKRELALGSGDIWHSVWSSVVKTGLRQMDDKTDHKRNWKPNVLLFSGGTNHRPHLLEFSKELVGNRGIVTNFDLHENQEAAVLFPKHKQSVSDDILKKYGVFGRRIEVKNVFKGIESIASTFGFSGIEPNTILMGWAKNTKDPIWFAQMTQKLIDLDYNVLYLDYDERFGFRKYAQIDLWWRGVGSNAELMLNVAKFLIASELWRNARIRIILVDETNSHKKIIEKKINKLLEEIRVVASIKVIGNAIEKRSIYELMKVYSMDTDLVLVGIPGIKKHDVENFVSTSNDLVGTIGTTLLVKASSQFDDVKFVSTEESVPALAFDDSSGLPAPAPVPESVLAREILKFETGFEEATTFFVENTIQPIEEKYSGLYQLILSELKQLEHLDVSKNNLHQEFSSFFEHIQKKFKLLRTEELPILYEIFSEDNHQYLDSIEALFEEMPTRLKIGPKGKNTSIRYKKAALLLKEQTLLPFIRDTYIDFGEKCFEHLFKTSHDLVAKVYALFELDGLHENNENRKAEIWEMVSEMKSSIKEQVAFFQNLSEKTKLKLLTANRYYCNELTDIAQQPDIRRQLSLLKKQTNKKQIKSNEEVLWFFPDNWHRNQEVIHTSIETDLKLAESNLLVNKGLERLKMALKEGVNLRIQTQFSTDSETIQAIREEYDKGGEIQSLDKFQIDENIFVEAETFMQNLKTPIKPISKLFDEDAVLMSQALMEDFETLQLEGLLPITLDLPKIVDFIIESKLIGAVHEHLEHYLRDVSNLYFNQANRINLLKYSLSESKERKETGELLEKMQTMFAEEYELFETTRQRFNETIRTIEYELQMELDTHYLVEHADNWSRYISVSKRKKGITRVSDQVKTTLSGWYEDMGGIVSTKQHESTVSVFESKYEVKSNIELGLNFVNTMYPEKAVLKALPFYYKQLFQGKQLPVQNDYIGRVKELAQLDKALLENRNGAILIAGKSASGKTHFSEYLADVKFKGKVFKIDSFGKQGKVKEFHSAIAVATKQKGAAEQCLSALSKGAVLLFNDIEVWWDRQSENDALSLLIGLVEKFHQRHTFILNINLHALMALSKQRPVKKVVTSTIVLFPVTKEALQTIILERHKIGGLDMEFRGEENRYEGKHFKHLMNKIYAESNGNVGLGLQIWLRQIAAVSENKIFIKEKPNLEMLKVSEAQWKWLLYQFIINKNLTRSKLAALFGEDMPELASFLRELINAEILEEVNKNIFTLNNVVKPNIENWLENHQILN